MINLNDIVLLNFKQSTKLFLDNEIDLEMNEVKIVCIIAKLNKLTFSCNNFFSIFYLS